jgi:hypothetical protein
MLHFKLRSLIDLIKKFSDIRIRFKIKIPERYPKTLNEQSKNLEHSKPKP